MLNDRAARGRQDTSARLNEPQSGDRRPPVLITVWAYGDARGDWQCPHTLPVLPETALGAGRHADTPRRVSHIGRGHELQLMGVLEQDQTVRQ
jgi:hypothetical protein